MHALKEKDDNQLVILYQQGENRAFDVLLDRYQDKLFSYIYFLIRNREMAEDVFQETFVKAIVTIRQGKYVDNGKFSAWITRIAHNLVIDHFRQEKNERLLSNDDDQREDLFNNINLSEKTIEHQLINEQIDEDVRKLITFLPQDQQEVVMMRYYQEMSFKEIANHTGVSINTALGRMRYAVLNMRKMANEKQMILY